MLLISAGVAGGIMDKFIPPNNYTPFIMDKTKNKILDNLHIILWLLKDMCWSVDSKLGIIMIPPTIIVSFFILIKQIKNINSLIYNIAICLWIIANSLWMVSELYKFEEVTKPIVFGCFTLGVIIIFGYYVTLFVKKLIK